MLVLQQSLDIGQWVRIVGGSQRVEDLCEVTDVTLKTVWVMDVNGALFFKRKQHVVIESPLHNVKHEPDV